MGNLGDFFPDSFLEEFSDKNLTLGSVLKIYDPDAKKDKYHIIVGFNETEMITASVRINSEVNLNVFRTPYLKSLCHLIKKEKYSFLKHDSVVDCSNLKEWPNHVLKARLMSNPGSLEGNIEEREFDTIRSILSTARTIPPKKRKKYGLQ